MSSDLFDELAETPVPPPPVEFDRGVHERLNRALLTAQVLEFAVSAIPFACMHLAKAVGGWIVLTVSGKFPERTNQPNEQPDDIT